MNPKCPACKSEDTIPVAYGMPSDTMTRAVEERGGDVKLGGPYIEDPLINWHCRTCKLDLEGPRELANRRISRILNEIKFNRDEDK